MREKIKKVKTIIKAFTEDLPVDEKWFQDRMEICNGCEFNSKNIAKTDLSTESKIKNAISLCPQGDHCTKCGCCTHEKASQKIEVCGLAEAGEAPKWEALEVDFDDKISFENLTPDSGVLGVVDNVMVYDLGETEEGRIDFVVRIKRKGGFDVKSARVGCKCTVAETKIIDKNTAEFALTISTKDFRSGSITTRSFEVEYYAKPNTVKKVNLKLKVILK